VSSHKTLSARVATLLGALVVAGGLFASSAAAETISPADATWSNSPRSDTAYADEAGGSLTPEPLNDRRYRHFSGLGNCSHRPGTTFYLISRFQNPGGVTHTWPGDHDWWINNNGLTSRTSRTRLVAINWGYAHLTAGEFTSAVATCDF
jgi:hypothetical protein